MNQKNKNSAWFYNKTSRDIILSELGLKLPAGQALDFFSFKKGLRPEVLHYAERFGALAKKISCGDIIKLDGPLARLSSTSAFSESTDPIYSKIKSSVEIEPGTKDFVDQLQDELMQDIGQLTEEEQVSLTNKTITEISVDDLEGFSDPLKED